MQSRNGNMFHVHSLNKRHKNDRKTIVKIDFYYRIFTISIRNVVVLNSIKC